MIDHELARGWLRSLAPPPIIAPTTFAESQIILPGSANAIPGPLRLTAYQREPIDAIADDDVEIIVLMLASQTGKSTIINAIMGHCIAADPGPMLHVSPTGARSEEFVRERFDPLVASSPALREIVGTGQNTRKGSSGGVNNVSAKTFPGGQLNFASSFKADELAARAIRFLFLDEVDRFAQSAGPEGDPIALAVKRTKTFEGKGRKLVIVSTPTSRLGSRINQWFVRGDQRRFVVTCPDCSHCSPIAFENLHWEQGKPETAYLACEECGAVHTEAQRRAMVEQGKWEATATGEPGIRSYHLTELTSLFSSLSAVTQQFEAAKTPEQKQAFYNTTLAQTYDAGTEVELSSSELQQRAERIVQPYAASIAFVSAGVDVQGDRLECTYLAHHSDQTFTVLNHLKLPGDTSGDAVWMQLDAALGMTFDTTDGRKLPVRICAVDSGFSADQVVKFVQAQRRKSRAVYAVKGRGGFDRLPLVRGGRLKGQMGLLIVGVDTVKLSVQKALALDSGPGFIRLPDHLDTDYFEGLASEELRVRYVKGSPRYEYHRTVKRNEPLDCLVYATTIAKALNEAQTAHKPPAPTTPKPTFAESAKRLAALSQHTR
ncbi:phage terminase large subunit family protein [Bradyrhizobium sp. Arg237L]|uniref:phage terminase large subunit family protein n=1 Tax=Bradyrhizobium sp. Arg237L TaxID=3003352 RepID=UPI00249ECE26|nr:terminase gpA endonuclease subunit [Bradyrhizobium sp. Arg237L]MDI4236802.1 phage terminase large subunit family protein [Bradyrhizobium sp. Arg237L]